MIYLVVIVIALLIGGVLWFVRDLRKGAQAAPYKAEPTVIPSITVADKPVDAVIPVTSQVPSTLAYFDPNRVVVDAKPVTRQTALIGNGGPVEHKTGRGIYAMPDVRAGSSIEVECSRGYSPISLTIRDAYGNAVEDNAGTVLNGISYPTGAFNVRFVAKNSGTFSVELTGGGDLTTLNHWRR